MPGSALAPPLGVTEKLEREARFKDWLRFHRYLDFVSDEQLEAFAVHAVSEQCP